MKEDLTNMETIQSKLWAMTVWVVIVKLLLSITNPLRVHLTPFLPDKLCLSDIALPLILICFLIATAWWLDETIVLHICNAHLILGVFKCFAWMSKCSFYMTVVRKHESVLVLQCQWSERTGLLGKKCGSTWTDDRSIFIVGTVKTRPGFRSQKGSVSPRGTPMAFPPICTISQGR